MKIFISRLVVIIAMYTLAYYSAIIFGMGYGYLFPESLGGGSLIPVSATEWIRGIPLALIFFITTSLNLLGGKHIWWWNIIALLPAIFIEVVLDPLHLYVPIIIGALAWWLGKMANKGLRKIAPEFMSKIS